MITYTTLGVPYYKYIIMGSQSPILIIKAPIRAQIACVRSRIYCSPSAETARFAPPSPAWHRRARQRRSSARSRARRARLLGFRPYKRDSARLDSHHSGLAGRGMGKQWGRALKRGHGASSKSRMDARVTGKDPGRSLPGSGELLLLRTTTR